MDTNVATTPTTNASDDRFAPDEIAALTAFAATLPSGSLDLESGIHRDPPEIWMNADHPQFGVELQHTYYCRKHHDGNFGVGYSGAGDVSVEVDGISNLAAVFNIIQNDQAGVSLAHTPIPRAAVEHLNAAATQHEHFSPEEVEALGNFVSTLEGGVLNVVKARLSRPQVAYLSVESGDPSGFPKHSYVVIRGRSWPGVFSVECEQGARGVGMALAGVPSVDAVINIIKNDMAGVSMCDLHPRAA